MKWIADAARELVGLFVDDGSLAIAVLAWVAIAVLAFPTLPVDGGWLRSPCSPASPYPRREPVAHGATPAAELIVSPFRPGAAS